MSRLINLITCGLLLHGTMGGCASLPLKKDSSQTLERIVSRSYAEQERRKYEREKPGGEKLPDWVYQLRSTPRYIQKLPDEDKEGDKIPCGPRALYYAIRLMNSHIDSIESLNSKRKGGFFRNLLGVFNEEAHEITWPGEIQKIANDYGINVKTITGNSATVKCMIEEYKKGNTPIARVGKFFNQHYAVFDPQVMKEKQKLVFYDETALDKQIHEIYILQAKTK